MAFGGCGRKIYWPDEYNKYEKCIEHSKPLVEGGFEVFALII
jgi:hypothetical protein